jgi:transcriptional regulator with XRE-family HTH domain
LKKSIYSDKQRKLCAILSEARQKAGLTQFEMAEKLKRPQSFVAKYESGDRRIDVIELLEIAKYLKIDPRKILEKLL